MPSRFTTRFTRRQVLAALALLPADYALAASSQPPASQETEPPGPASVAAAIAEASELLTVKKFAETIAVLEKKQKALGTEITDAEKRALLINIAVVHFFWGDQARAQYQFQEAILHYQSAYVIFKIYRPREAAINLNNIGLVYDALAEKSKALNFYNQALPILQAVGDKANEAMTLNNIGAVYSALGEKSKALESYNQALPLQRQVSDKSGEAMTLSNIGVVYDDLGEKGKSLEFYNQALPILKAVGDKSGEAMTLSNIGAVYSALGEKGKALDFYNQALPLQRQISDKLGEATTLNNIGFVYASLGEKSKALYFFNQALPILKAVGDKSVEATTLNNIGGVYDDLGEKSKALEFYNQALPILKAVGDKSGEANTLNNIGGVYDDLGEKSKSLEFYNQALTLSRQVGDTSVEAMILDNIGVVYASLGEKGKALDFFNHALTLSRQVGDTSVEAATTGCLMSLFASVAPPLGNPSLAVTFGKQSVNLYQALRVNIQTLDKSLQTTFTKSVEPAYRKLADILIGLSRLPEAQQILDRLKAREFTDFTRPDTVLPMGNSQTDLTTREADAKKRSDDAGDRITALSREFDALSRTVKLEPTEDNKRRLAVLEKQLGEAQTEFSRMVAATIAEFQAAKPGDARDKLETVPETRSLTATLSTLSAQTKQNTVAIYTLVAEERLHHLVFTPQSLTAKTTAIKGTDLEKLVADFRITLEDPRLDPRPLGQKLYNLLIAPIAEDLTQANAQNILWSLDGALRYVPLAALSPEGKTYLVEKSERHSLFSPGALPNLTAETKAQWSAAAFGVTRPRTEDGLTFDALLNVGEEIQAVGKTVPTNARLDDAFTEQILRDALRARPPLVHIASHFAFRPYDPPSSFLLLGKGKLTLDAMSKINLFGGVDLLTLSACDTATGGTASGNGKEVDSLAFLAQQQGAGAVMASLWPVNDASTRALMQSFYALHQTNPGLGKVECLRQSQRAILSGTIKPEGVRGGKRVDPPPVKGKPHDRRGKPSAEIPLPTASADFVPFPKNENIPCAHPFYWAAFTLMGNTK